MKKPDPPRTLDQSLVARLIAEAIIYRTSGTHQVGRHAEEGRHQCKRCHTNYSVLVGTPLQNSKLDLQKWICGVQMIMSNGNTISVRKLALTLKINKNTAAYMITRVNDATASEKMLLAAIGGEL